MIEIQDDLPPSDPQETESGHRIAAIDIGSNSMRLVVAQVIPGPDYRILDEEREATRLARSLSVHGHLDEQAIEDSLAALRRFKKIALGFGVQAFRTIATCAVREATNSDEFCRRALEEVGIEIEVISAELEGQLAFRSVERAFDISDTNVAIADIGGGSTEILFASGGFIEEIIPTQLGAVRMTEMYGEADQLFSVSSGMSRLREEIDRDLKRLLKRKPFVPHQLIGTGGTFTSLASILMASKGEAGQPEWGYRITRADVSHVLDMLSKLTIKQRRAVPGLSADRADIIIAGLAIIDRLMQRLQVNILRVHDRGIRDGLLLTMIEDAEPAPQNEADNLQVLETFARGCGVDMVHTRHVANLAVEIFDQLVEPCGISPADRRLLYTSAMLQDCGYLINYEKHHKHSYNLILNSQLPGYSRSDLEIIANVARYHRGSNPKRKHRNFTRLAPNDQIRVKQMAAILRIAGALDRSHTQQVTQTSIHLENGHLHLEIVANGDPEVDLWAARSRTDLFCRVFEMEVHVSLDRERHSHANVSNP